MLLAADDHKNIILDSLRFLVNNKRIWLFGFVIMPNHIHVLWSKHDSWFSNIQQSFLKFTAQQIKFKMLKLNPRELEKYKSTQRDRAYHFWERRPYTATIGKRNVASQKLDYMHWNPVKAGICNLPEDYFYSSARFYEQNVDDWGFLTHYADHF